MLRPLALTGVSALLYSAAFPPWSVAPLAWIAIAPLLIAVARTTPSRAALLGIAWAVAMAYGVGTWFPGMIEGYFERSPSLGALAFVATAVVSAGLQYGAFAAWTSALVRLGAASPAGIAAAWVASELARERLLLKNPWALSAYSQAGAHAVIQTADLAGPHGAGFVLAAVNAAVAALVVPELRGSRPRITAAGIVLLLAIAIGYGEWRLAATPSSDPPVGVAIVQTGIGRGFRWRPEYQHRGLDEHIAATMRAASPATRIVVWPEYAVSFYPEEHSAEQDRLLAASRALAADLIIGGPHYEFTAAGATAYHNSVYLLQHGAITARYDKIRLLPLAEDAGAQPYVPGERSPVLRANAAAVGALICFEAMYPDLTRRAVLDGAQVLASLSNDSWFGSASAARHHLDIATVRAIESRRWMVRATPTGFSAVIDPYGHVVASSGYGEASVVSASVSPAPAPITPYTRWGDVFACGCVVAVVAQGVALIGRRRR